MMVVDPCCSALGPLFSLDSRNGHFFLSFSPVDAFLELNDVFHSFVDQLLQLYTGLMRHDVSSMLTNHAGQATDALLYVGKTIFEFDLVL